MFSSKPVKGMFDVTPQDMLLRNWVRKTIEEVYTMKGYEQLETPAVENLDLLIGSEGGENLSLIFKILKRGEKLTFDELSENALSDLGLRYDLTLPLSRFYADNMEKLSRPFKAFQMGYVYRAERPQKMRFRQFIQCDVDIIGDPSIYAEVDLLLTLPKALQKLGFDNLKIRINDRRILKELILGSGFTEEQFMNVCMTIDKIDKIGVDGVVKELSEQGYEKEYIDDLMKKITMDLKDIEGEYAADLQRIIELVEPYFKVEADLSLVRGMGYYTGPIFEIGSEEFSGSIAGGGRYDDLLSKFKKEQLPAVGFSIGFERIVNILKERGFQIPNEAEKIAVLFYEENRAKEAVEKVEALNAENKKATFFFCKKNKLGNTKKRLENSGYTQFIVLE